MTRSIVKLLHLISLGGSHAFLANGFSLAYALIILNFPYKDLLDISFSDRDNYLDNYTRIYSVTENHFSGSAFNWILGESLWSFAVHHIANVFNSGIMALNLISFFSAFVVTRYALIRSGNAYLVVLFFSPLMIDFFLSQSRMAFAFAVFLLALSSSRKFLRLGFIFLCSTIHFSFLVIGPLLAYKEIIYKYYSRYFNLISVSLIIITSIVAYKISEVNFLQMAYEITGYEYGRQGDYIHVVTSSPKYLTIWLIYLIMVTISRRPFLENSSALISFALILSFITFDLMQLSGIRLLTIAYPFFIISLQYLSYYKRIIFIILYLLYTLLYWLYWTQTLI